MQKRLISFILVAYSAILIKVVVFKDLELRTRFLIIRLGSSRTGLANFVPFKTILPHLRGEPRWSIAIMNLVGNTALFVPIGFLVPLVCRKMTWQKSLALAVAVGLAMEGMEGLFRMGAVDVDDIILNAFGVMIGYGVFTIFRSAKGDVAASATTTTTQ